MATANIEVFDLIREVSVCDAITLTSAAEHTTYTAHTQHTTYNPDHRDYHNSLPAIPRPPSRPTVPRRLPESHKRAAAKSEVSGAALESSISFARLRETLGRDLSGFRLMARRRGILRESSGLAEGGGAMGDAGQG
ncbi:hypothetical protein E2C01_056083 [Portunus trituberculatus]|uniref:Uncharacterized protein n=1 Tax=Portunus trituberculatus TaxID=210409 RepID=A0A5B7GZE1_PORTR|nr:hypothetical protein [Portunus trituberculatus]